MNIFTDDYQAQGLDMSEITLVIQEVKILTSSVHKWSFSIWDYHCKLYRVILSLEFPNYCL